jgi:hypothetical protein
VRQQKLTVVQVLSGLRTSYHSEQAEIQRFRVRR